MPNERKNPRAPSFRAFCERVGERKHDTAGFVLAGGQSSRMGQDKALVPFAGRPLIAQALEIFREAGLAPSIAGARSSLAEFAPVIEDPEPGSGPLTGICAALASTQARWNVFLPVDLPLLPPSLITSLLRHAQTTGRAITVASISAFAQTFPAIVDRAALPALQRELAAARLGCFNAFQAASNALGQSLAIVPVELLVQAGQAAHPAGLPPFRWFLNVNAPHDLHRAGQLLARPIA